MKVQWVAVSPRSAKSTMSRKPIAPTTAPLLRQKRRVMICLRVRRRESLGVSLVMSPRSSGLSWASPPCSTAA